MCCCGERLEDLLCSVIGETSMDVLLRRRVTLLGVLQTQSTTFSCCTFTSPPGQDTNEIIDLQRLAKLQLQSIAFSSCTLTELQGHTAN